MPRHDNFIAEINDNGDSGVNAIDNDGQEVKRPDHFNYMSKTAAISPLHMTEVRK